MPMRIPPFALALALSALPARALNVSGRVIDGDTKPVPGAKVCPESDASHCVDTDASGAFHLQTVTPIRVATREVPAYGMRIREGRLILAAPASAQAEAEWIGSDGRSLTRNTALRLVPGPNAIALPAEPSAGIRFLRITTADASMAWKVVLAGSRPASATRASEPPRAASTRVLSLAKVEAPTRIEASKAGYRTRYYQPVRDPEPEAVILLRAESDAGLNFTGNFRGEVIAIDRAKKAMIVESVDASCDSEKVVHDTARDTSQYAFRDGRMWLWAKGDCVGQAFTGTGTDPVGTWTLSEEESELPADLRAGCVPDTSEPEDPIFTGFAATYVITETSVTGDVSVDVCPADLYGPMVAALFEGDSTVTTARNTCRQVVYKNGKGETGALDFSKKGDSLQADFIYKTTDCAFTQDLALSDKDPVCPGNDKGDFIPFFFCTAESGFADILGASAGSPGVSGAAKVSVGGLPMSLERGSIFSSHGWPFGTAR